MRVCRSNSVCVRVHMLPHTRKNVWSKIRQNVNRHEIMDDFHLYAFICYMHFEKEMCTNFIINQSIKMFSLEGNLFREQGQMPHPLPSQAVTS